MTSYKVVIPCAGIGSRVGPYTKFINKALITLGGKPAIARIIERFEPEIEIIILLGFKGEHIRQTLTALFPERRITFVNVDKFEGEGSGLGYSLLQARNLLECPFLFISNDTIISDENRMLDPNLIGNWIGYYEKSQGDGIPISEYRTIEHTGGMLQAIYPKGINANSVYVGFCGIRDHENFWGLMTDERAIEIGEALAIQSLPNVKAVEFQEWSDIGSITGVETARNRFRLDDVNILEKENEAIWFANRKVFKFHTDETFIAERVKRLQFLDKDLFPKIEGTDKNLYSYEFTCGKVLTQTMTVPNALKLLDFCHERLWSQRVNDEDVNFDRKKCIDSFYRKKTYARVHDYLLRFEAVDEAIEINGVRCDTTVDTLSTINWNALGEAAIFAHFHGDFHSENILIADGKFKLLDWRQNFGEAGHQFGDVYYDLAKFLHGLIVSHEKVSQNQYTVFAEESGATRIDIDRPFVNVEAEVAFKAWCEQRGYSFEVVEILTSLIFLNIAALHEYPYSKFLFYLGRYLLTCHRDKNSFKEFFNYD